MSFPVFMTTPLGIAQEVTDPNEYRCVGHHEKAHFGPRWYCTTPARFKIRCMRARGRGLRGPS
jgi:hypothetical protein